MVPVGQDWIWHHFEPGFCVSGSLPAPMTMAGFICLKSFMERVHDFHTWFGQQNMYPHLTPTEKIWGTTWVLSGIQNLHEKMMQL